MIAVDAMGGDNAPEQIVLGSLLASRLGISIKLFGCKETIISILDKNDFKWKKYDISILDADQIIGMAEEPVNAVRKKINSSIVKAIQSVKQKKCKAVVSAGNTGAFMAAASLILGKKPEINRVPIIGVLPIKDKKKVLCLDIGANVDCKPEYLVQFAYLAKEHARNVLNLDNPRIALLSNGHEEGKGNMLVKKAYELLKKSDLNFVGNIEPYSIFNYYADIIVSDGFSGNIFLKTIEACAQNFITQNYEIGKDGALLLGVKGIVVAVHGNANAQAIKNAIILARNTVVYEENFYGVCEKSIDRTITKDI
ncbi:phosphate acyltransferase PlsX [Candidatus Dependentiae bacterium]|nr:phosphate acyltransferase PlsX [Candidatus Dependentiae bacterium]